MKEIQRLRDAHQLVESHDPDSDDSVENSSPVEPPQPKPRPPIIPGNDILTPIPVTVAPSNATGSQSSSSGDETVQAAQAVNSDSEGKSKTNAKEGESVVPLGEMSIREFEGTINNDPFEITSLQAINDMEILQTVLQPIPPPIMTLAVTAATNTSVAGAPPLAPPTNIATTGPAPSSTHQSSPTLVHGSGSSSNLQLLNQQQSTATPGAVVSSSAATSATTPTASSAVLPPGPAPSLPVQVPQRAGSAPVVGVASGSSPSNPFHASGAFAAVSNQMIPQYQQQPLPPISIGAPPTSTATPPISTNPFSAVSPPAVGARPSFPPPPSSTGVGTLIDIGQPSMPPSSTTTPPVVTGGSPSIPPRSNPPIPRPRTAPASHSSPAPSQTPAAAAPVPAQRSVSPRHCPNFMYLTFFICRVAVVHPTVPHGRPGLGVPVLPPIPSSTPPTAGPTHHPHPPTTSSSSSASAVPTLPPPPYKARPSPPSQHRDTVAPPPYTPPADGQRSGGQSSPRQPARPAAPPVTPRTYKLPDPSVSQLAILL